MLIVESFITSAQCFILEKIFQKGNVWFVQMRAEDEARQIQDLNSLRNRLTNENSDLVRQLEENDAQVEMFFSTLEENDAQAEINLSLLLPEIHNISGFFYFKI